jgi:DUF2934 family protein
MSKSMMEQFSEAAHPEDATLEQLLEQGAGAQRQAIEKRAYQMFLEHGSLHGHDLHDWLEAERQLYGRAPFR